MRVAAGTGGIAAGGVRCLRFDLAHLGFKCLEFLARTQQHRALHFELLAGHEIELGKSRLQHRLEVFLEVFAGFAQAGRHQATEAAGQFVDGVEMDHHGFLDCRLRLARGGIACRRLRPWAAVGEIPAPCGGGTKACGSGRDKRPGAWIVWGRP